MELLHDPYAWVIFSFAVFVAVAYRFGKPAVLSALDQKIKTITEEIENARKLRDEAQALLSEFETRERHAAAETEQILADARQHAEHIRLAEEQRLADMMARKEQQLNERIALLRDQAVADLRNTAATLAAQATETLVTQKMDDATRAKLLDRALDQVQQRLQA
jgi:F-type H+-transporting ATPase subunit b